MGKLPIRLGVRPESRLHSDPELNNDGLTGLILKQSFADEYETSTWRDADHAPPYLPLSSAKVSIILADESFPSSPEALKQGERPG